MLDLGLSIRSISVLRTVAPAGPPPALPVNTVLPVVTGTTEVGETLTTTDGTWDNEPTSYAYQWMRALLDGGGNVITDGDGRPLGVEISGETNSTYVLQAADEDEHIFCEVTATNAAGSASISSDAVGPITAAAGGWPTLSVTSGLIGRWRANAGVTESGGNVTAVADQSGSGHNLANDGTAPFNATGFNGKPAFDFAVGNDAALVCDPFGFGTGTDYTIVVIGQMDTGTASFGGAVSYGDGAGSDFNTSGYGAFLTRNDTNAEIQTKTAPTAALNTAMTTGAPHVFLYRNEASVDRSHWIDGVEGTPASADPTNLIDAGVLVIGNRFLTGAVGGAAWDGPIAEVLIYNRALSDVEIATIQSYAEHVDGWAI